MVLPSDHRPRIEVFTRSAAAAVCLASQPRTRVEETAMTQAHQVNQEMREY
jgi:hypothetical protein